MTDFLTLDEVEVETTIYGVKVSRMGENLDEGAVAFTHDRRRAIAAVLALFRSEGDRVQKLTVVEPKWWRVVDNCGCGDTCACEKDEDGDTNHDECVGTHYGLPPCHEQIYTFIGLESPADSEGAIPVIKMEVSLW